MNWVGCVGMGWRSEGHGGQELCMPDMFLSQCVIHKLNTPFQCLCRLKQTKKEFNTSSIMSFFSLVYRKTV